MSAETISEQVAHAHPPVPGNLSECPPSTSTHNADSTLTSMVTPDDVMRHYEKHFGLNAKQKNCFRIICQWFVNKHILKNNNQPPLSMVMTGPGGTGKMYVINAVKAVMSHYRCDHQIRYLAPTGSAASLINGMTIHKGLGI
ncbi:hypothetical protein DEU56DRAFT_728254, partial [Suillus clintonianus]|uniref:uncharacterized protein n=1 Tax=Suillus clintonianus TaxID=1904413 RepID=UPI001B873856